MNELAILVTAAAVALVVALAYIYAALHDGPPAHEPDHFRLPLFPDDDHDNDWN